MNRSRRPTCAGSRRTPTAAARRRAAPMRTRALPAGVAGTTVTTAGHDVAGEHRLRPAVGREALERVPFGDDVARRLAVAAAPLVDAAQAAIERAHWRPPAARRRASSAPGGRPRRARRRRTSARASLRMSSTKYGAIERSGVGWPRSTSGRAAASRGLLARDEAFIGHPRQHVVVAPRQRAVRVDERAEPRRRLDDRGDGRGLLERQLLRRLVEVHPRAPPRRRRRRAEIDLVGVEA